VLKGFGMLFFLARFLFELVWHRKEEQRVIFLPGQYLEGMRENALLELGPKSNEREKPFISESDTLYAWWSRTMLTALRPALHSTILLMNIFDIRHTLANDINSPNFAYVANSSLFVPTCLPARQILQRHLSFVASQLRCTLEHQRTREQVEALAALQKQSIEKTSWPPLIGDSNSLLIICTNLHKGKIFNIYFSPAVLVSGVPQKTNKLGRPSNINWTSHYRNYSLRNVVGVIGKDADGNWWLTSNMRTEAWLTIDRKLRAMSCDFTKSPRHIE
jgi:hypothetical protein